MDVFGFHIIARSNYEKDFNRKPGSSYEGIVDLWIVEIRQL